MAIIGQSKNSGLYQKVTEEGSRYREIKYADLGYENMWNGQPVLHGYIPEKPGQMLGSDAVSLLRTEGIPPVTQGRTDVDLKSNILLPVTARIDDTERITRLLTKVPGIKWEAHNVGLGAIQNNLESKRGKLAAEAGGDFWDTLLQIGRNLLQGAVGALDVTATTLSQVAVAGTGEHFSSWLLANKSYIGKGAAEVAMSSGKVALNPNELSYYQLPMFEEGPVEEARKPKMRGAEIEAVQMSPDSTAHWSTENTFGGPDSNLPGYNDFTHEESMFNEHDEADLENARAPKNVKEGDSTNASRFGLTGEVPKTREPLLGDREPSLISGSFQPFDIESELVSRSLENARAPKNVKEGGVPGSFKALDVNTSGSCVSEHPTLLNEYLASGSQEYDPTAVSGPWKHDGAHALVAGTTENNKNDNYEHGYVRDTQSTKNMPTGNNANTRVDNGRIDLIPFWIRAISADGTVKDNAYLFFEANLDSYSDNYDASWESTQYIGRADKFWTYNGFDRQISFSFKMVAHSKSHLKPIYNRLNGLLSMTTPTYGSNGVFMQGTLAEITIGDLLSRQLGFIKSVGLKWETDYMWETDGGTIIVPHVLDVSVGFTPIHQFVPQLRRRYFELVGDTGAGVPTFTVNYNKLYKK